MKVRKAAFHEKNLTGGLSARNEEATQLSVCPSVCLSGLKQRKQMVAHKTLLKRKKEKKMLEKGEKIKPSCTRVLNVALLGRYWTKFRWIRSNILCRSYFPTGLTSWTSARTSLPVSLPLSSMGHWPSTTWIWTTTTSRFCRRRRSDLSAQGDFTWAWTESARWTRTHSR